MQPDPYVVFGIPTFTSHVSYEFAGCFAQAMHWMGQEGIKCAFIFMPDMQFVEVARNTIVKKFLEEYPDGTDLFFIDDDLGFAPTMKVVEFIKRDEDIIAGVYPKRSDNFQFHVAFDLEHTGENVTFVERNGLLRANQIAGGFLRIKRGVVERLASESPTYGVVQPDGSSMAVFDVFDRGVIDGEFVGEDTYFCRKALAAGFDIWVDPNIEFHHRGSTKWSGCIGDEIRKMQVGEPSPARLVRAAE